jgi:hypothetical protein
MERIERSQQQRTTTMGQLTGPDRTSRAGGNLNFNGGNGNGSGTGNTGGNTGGSQGSNSGSGSGATQPWLTPNGVIVTPKDDPKHKPLEHLIPDVTPPPPTTQNDLTPIVAGPITEPRRIPLQQQALGGSFPTQAGITGYSGVFIP